MLNTPPNPKAGRVEKKQEEQCNAQTLYVQRL
jgi:hypothetical protein